MSSRMGSDLVLGLCPVCGAPVEVEVSWEPPPLGSHPVTTDFDIVERSCRCEIDAVDVLEHLTPTCGCGRIATQLHYPTKVPVCEVCAAAAARRRWLQRELADADGTWGCAEDCELAGMARSIEWPYKTVPCPCGRVGIHGHCVRCKRVVSVRLSG